MPALRVDQMRPGTALDFGPRSPLKVVQMPAKVKSARLFRATLPCEAALWLFHDVDRRRKLKGWASTWMSHHQILRLDGDQVERCDGNLPFASRLMALLSTTDHWGGTGFCRRRNPIFRRCSY